MNASADPAPPPASWGWLVIIGLILTFWALKTAYAVFMPIAASAFLVALVHPLYQWLRDRTHAAVGLLVAFLVVVAGLAAFFGLVGWALSTVIAQLPEYEQELRQSYNTLEGLLERTGLAIPDSREAVGDQLSNSQAASDLLKKAGLKLQAFVTYFVLVLAFVALGLPEMNQYARKFEHVGGKADKLHAAARDIAHKFRAYTGAITASAAITAVLTVAFGLAIGLEFALVFALISFLMNYVPTIGSVIAVIPPTLFAFIQFDGLTMPLAVFCGFAAIELTVGNYVAPKVEGRILALAPTVVLAAIVFWGWLWGVIGALLAVPLTMAIALFCEHFDQARWVGYVIRERADADAP